MLARPGRCIFAFAAILAMLAVPYLLDADVGENMAEHTWWETIKIESDQLVQKVKELIEKATSVASSSNMATTPSPSSP